jgi:nucleotide-binding universal stress UspA family protein
MFKSILVAIDGSEQSLKAARVAGEVANTMESETLWVVIAFDPVPGYLGQPLLQEAINERIKQTDAILNKGLQEIGKFSGTLKTEVLAGPPAEAVLSVADTRQVDLIVMGTRGLGRLTGALVGSQSQKVVAHANCPVLLVR